MPYRVSASRFPVGVNVALVPSGDTARLPAIGYDEPELDGYTTRFPPPSDTTSTGLLNLTRACTFNGTFVTPLAGSTVTTVSVVRSTVPLVAKVEVTGVVMVLPLRSVTPATVRV
jgi:hypothetical protein